MTESAEHTGQNQGVARRLVFLETFGCQMNDNDSDRMLGFLRTLDYARTDEPSRADLIIINTCSIRDKAEQKVYSTLGRYKPLKARRPGLIIGVAGCVAQQEGGRLLKRVPYLDLVFGPHNIHRLADLIGAVQRTNERVVATEFNDTIDEGEYGSTPVTDGLKAQLSIMRGCDNFCSYCIVPYTRGREVSRSSEEIIQEIQLLASSGVKEVTLLGQNVNSYGARGADVPFPDLLRMVASVDGIERVRFVTSHPKDISVELINLFAELKKLCRHIHLPVQSGSDAVLRRMKRVYTRDEYLSHVRRIRDLYPDMAITTDIIVGFPGETESDFRLTMDLIEDVRYDNIFSFMYSPRPGTGAAEFSQQVPLEVRSRRLQALQGAQRDITLERNRALVGRTVEVLAEGPSKADPEELMGRTPCNRIVNFPALSGCAGQVVRVTITDAFQNSLRGRLFNERSSACFYR